MSEHEFQAKLAELMGEISTLPPAEREKLEQLASSSPSPMRTKDIRRVLHPLA